jgi:type VI secretion system ImpM family protein
MSSPTEGARVGFYGKVGTQADFLRVNAGEFIEAGLDRWFEEGVETLRAERTALPAEPTAFFLATPQRGGGFVGVFAPSRDAVGRSFPLVAFVRLPPQHVGNWAELPPSCDAFIRAAGAIVGASVEASSADLANHADALTGALPNADQPSGATDWPAESAAALRTAVAESPAALAYALKTFVTACDNAQKAGSGATTGVTTVDAPAPTAATLSFWLDLASRRLGWKEKPPSMLWSDGANGRLLLTLGAPAPNALAFLANSRHRSPRFWPLKTDAAAARDRALAGLTPAQKLQVENLESTLGEAVAAFVSPVT